MRESSYYLDVGQWFFSVYNDAGEPQIIEMRASMAHNFISNCLSGCSENGKCVMGRCECTSSFRGTDCSKSEY